MYLEDYFSPVLVIHPRQIPLKQTVCLQVQESGSGVLYYGLIEFSRDSRFPELHGSI